MNKVKKYRYLLIFVILLLFNISNVKAATEQENANKINTIIENSFKKNKWQVSSKDTSMEIKIPINDNNIVKLMENFSSSKLYMYGCSTKDKCNDNNWESNFSSSITFDLKIDENDPYLYASYVTNYNLDSFRSSANIYYDIETKNKGWLSGVVLGLGKKTYNKNGTFTFKNDTTVISNTNPVGSIANPREIGDNTNVIVPNKNDQFWDNNMCYYLTFKYTNSKSTVRYKITSNVDNVEDHSLGRSIFYASDATSTLNQNIMEDDAIDGVYAISNENKYAICNQYDVTYNFSYYDDKPLTVSDTNYPKQEIIENQNGEGSYETATNEEIAEAKAAMAGEWNPDSLCGEDNENCNIDITEFCLSPYVSRTLKFIGIILTVAKILVPAIIIILGFVDLIKIVISGKVGEAKTQTINIVKRLINGIIIFISPTIIITIYNIAYNIANDKDEVANGTLNVPENFKNCVGCLFDATNKESCIIDTSLIGETYEEMREYYQGSGNQNGRFGSGTFTQYSGVPESGYEESSSVSTRGDTTIKFDKEILVLSKDYVNYAKINANVKGLTWKSSNTKVATVNKNGEVRAKKAGSATITATAGDGSTAKIKVKVIKRAKYLGNQKWVIDKDDYTKQEKESYINLADELCHSNFYKQNPTNYTFCPAETLVYYSGTDRFKLTKHYMTKKLGLSATNYVVFVSSAKQTMTLLQKNSSGKWKVLKKGQTSTGKTNNKNHYRHDFWIGGIYVENSLGIVFQQFSKNAGRHCNFGGAGVMICDDWYASRAIHIGSQLGYPHSNGCGRITVAFRDYLYEHLKGKYGTRVIYF